MDKSTYSRQIKYRKRNTRWLRHGNKSLRGLTRATADIGSTKHPPECVFQYLKRIKMHTCQNGRLAKVFEMPTVSEGLTSSLLERAGIDNVQNTRELIPIIFLHGLAGSRTSQSGSCRDLASHGHIVFSIDHFDGSAYYSQK